MGGRTPGTFAELVSMLIGFISMLIPVLFALTILFLSWSLIKAWVINGGDQGSVEEGKQVAIAGVVALVVMVGVWGIIAIIQSSLGLDSVR